MFPERTVHVGAENHAHGLRVVSRPARLRLRQLLPLAAAQISCEREWAAIHIVVLKLLLPRFFFFALPLRLGTLNL